MRQGPLGAFAKPEIAAGCALHDRLASGQLELVVEAGQHGTVTIALDANAEIGEAKLFVELRVLTACDIEIEMIVGLRDQLDIHAASACPKLLRQGPQRRSRLAIGCRPPRAILGGEPAYRFVNDLAHCALT